MSKAALQKWAGHATHEGTSKYASGQLLGFQPAQGHFREHTDACSGVGGTPAASLVLSSLGVGTYLGRPDDATDEAVSNAGMCFHTTFCMRPRD